mgnify:CR=1 FL=1
MILRPVKVAYVKIPKTGSTTMSAAIWRHYGVDPATGSDEVVNLNRRDRLPLIWHGWHVEYRRIAAHLGAEAADYRFFALVREPVSRLVSVYRWQRQKQPGHDGLSSFAHFVETLAERPRALPAQARLHGRPQWSWICGEDATLPPIHLFLLEEFERRRPEIAALLGFDPDYETRNVSEKIAVAVDDATRARIHALYPDDVRLHAAMRADPDRFAAGRGSLPVGDGTERGS